jgi:MoxR-like ATPase
MTGSESSLRPVFAARELHELHRRFDREVRFTAEFLATYKGLVFQIRSEGVSLSDRRVVKLLKLFAASAIVDGRSEVNEGDLFLLRHIWNHLDQAELLEQVVSPVVDRFHRDHPEARRFGGGGATLDDILAELSLIRDLLTSGQALSDIQLFSQLKNLNEIKAALQGRPGDAAARMVREIDALLESVLGASKFG